MGHPVNGIQYLLDEWQYLKNRYNYYAFFLFTEKNEDFAKLYKEMMLRWDELSGDGTMFFAIAPPPEGWEEIAGARDYWKHFKANAHKDISYDDDAVKQVGRYFNVPESTFPNVVVFSDLKRAETLTIQLAGLSPEETQNYIENIFLLLDHPTIRRYRQLWRIYALLDHLPTNTRVGTEWIHSMVNAMRHRNQRVPRQNRNQRVPRQNRYEHPFYIQGQEVTPNYRVVRHESATPVEKTIQTILMELRRLTDEVADLREEQRGQFTRVNLSLERIEHVLSETIDRIDKKRAPFVEQWLEAEYTASSDEEVGAIREKLTQDFDNFILTQTEFLTRRLRASFHIPEEFSVYDDILEPNSRVALETSEALWDYFRLNPHESQADYSVCGIGLWKALEIELNRTFIDALRVYHNIATTGTQSVQQLVHRMNNIKEKGLFGQQYKPVVLNAYVDHDPTIDPTQLKGITLGALSALLQGASQNKLKELVRQINVPLESSDASFIDFLNKLGTQVQTITNRYRNAHAHMRQMDMKTYKAFRQLMLDKRQSHAPLFRTLYCKREMDKNRLI